MDAFRRVLGTLGLLAVMIALAGKTAEAKYLASQVTIDGPILHNPLVIDEEAEITQIIGGFFVVPGENVIAPAHPGHLFLLTVHTRDEDGRQFPVDRVVVSLDAAGRSAQLYRLGMVNGWSTGDGSWYEVAPEAVSLLLNTLKQGGVDFGPKGEILGLPSLPAAPTPSEPATVQWYFIGAVLAALVFLAGWWLGAGRRRKQMQEGFASERAS
ncbi:MAG: hypothetical protein WBR18_04435 [Anaerolineales bacterium]